MIRAKGFVSLVFLAASVSLLLAQTAQHGVLSSLPTVKFTEDSDVKCLRSAVESGDPDKGASTIILKAPPGCVVPWHYHTAQEQLMVVEGKVSTEMEGTSPAVLGPGGFGMMLSEEKHRFSCVSPGSCLMFVTFDRAYDIHWVTPKTAANPSR